VRRKLAAILAADVVDYSRQMGNDDLATLAAVKELFAGILVPCAEARGGRVFKTMGDGALAIFDSAVEAVTAAHELQQTVLQQGGKLQLRVGVHAGDVLIDGDDTCGDGVNIAARLQTLGRPGEIIVSGEVRRAVRRKQPFHFESRGTPPLKNIAEPIEVFVLLEGEDEPARGRASLQDTQASIIVLPFANLFVFAANSAFTYKGRAVRPSALSQELGVRYLLEGSVQKAGQKIRLNAQLIEAPSERHLWAERLDRGVEDLLEVQDEIVRHIVSVLAIRVSASEMERVGRKETADINAYDAFLRGAHAFLSQVDRSAETEAGLKEAEGWFERATRIDPTYARAWGWLGYMRITRVLEGWAPQEAALEAEDFAKRAVSLSPDDHDTHWALGFVYSSTGRLDFGLAEYEAGVALNPNDTSMLAEMAQTLSLLGRHQDAVKQIRQAIALNPYAPEWYRWMLGWALHHARNYRQSIAELERILKPNNEVRLILAASHARLAEACDDAAEALQHRREAERHCVEFRQRRADWTLEKERGKIHFQREEDLTHWLEGLSRAGLA